MADLQWNKDFALEQTAGDEELLDELIILFKDSSADDLKQLQAGVGADDAAAVAAAAHSLKGASASLGIEAILELAMDMEKDAREGSVSSARENITEMGELLKEIEKL